MKLQDITAWPHSMTDHVHVRPRAVDREGGGGGGRREKEMKFSDRIRRKHHRHTEL